MDEADDVPELWVALRASTGALRRRRSQIDPPAGAFPNVPAGLRSPGGRSLTPASGRPGSWSVYVEGRPLRRSR